jgi:succinate dehydrogenase flavin-adding protein (antitoxin of CptAB toxin-antitoxin module)
MLRNEKQVALDTVINSSRRSIEHYRWVADSSDEGQVKTLLYKLALHREMIIDKLAPQMYKLGDMPSSPDPEKVAVEEFVTQIKAAFSEDEKNVLSNNLDELDAQLLQEISDAYSLGFDEETMEMLRKLQEGVVDARNKREALAGG